MATSEPPAKHKYALRFMPEALDEWRQLDGSGLVYESALSRVLVGMFS